MSILNNVSSMIEEISEKNFFDYSIDDYKKIIPIMEKSEGYKEINSRRNNELSASLKYFKKFILEKEEVYLSIKISNPDFKDVVTLIKSNGQNIVIQQLNQLRDIIKIGQIVFMVPFGDKVEWEKGLCGIAKISKLPYDFEGKNYKININMFCSFKTIPRSEFICYPGTYDAADIGPSTRGSQTQAIKRITFGQTCAILRAIIELRPETKEILEKNISKEIMECVYGEQVILSKQRKTYEGNNLSLKNGVNKIFYGIPGCGKSYKIKKYLKDNHVSKENIFRITFYLDYSNSDFVGQILPKIDGQEVTYIFNPGPFTKALTRALNTDEMVYLIIEEINRGNAAAIFGDIFQLLDRKKETDSDGIKGESEYPIVNDLIADYLNKNVIEYDKNEIYIPSNLSIFATMNTSDQNVFPLDTAFKRRWDMERVEGNIEECEYKDFYIPFTNYTWSSFQKKVNKKISESTVNGMITEDKQLGPWFAKKDMFVDISKEETIGEQREKLKSFTYNVMDYIYNDVCKFEKDGWFEHNVTFDEICETIIKYADDRLGDKSQRNLCLQFLGNEND